jgi:hypothetical protein
MVDAVGLVERKPAFLEQLVKGHLGEEGLDLSARGQGEQWPGRSILRAQDPGPASGFVHSPPCCAYAIVGKHP